MKSKQLYIIMLVLSFAACGSSKSKTEYIVKNGDTLQVVREYDTQGHLETESTIDKDSLRQGIAKMFYENGKLHGEIHFKDGQKDGIEKSYYQSGKVKHTGLNTLGKQDSTWIWFYEDGTIRKIDNWINGKSFGDNLIYYEDGSLNEYNFFTFGGSAIYIRKYNKQGEIIEEDGRPVQVIYNRNHLRVNEKFEMAVLLGIMPDWNVDVTIGELNGKLLKKCNEAELIKGVSNNKVIIENNFKQAGIYHWLVDVKINDPKYNRKIWFKDTIEITVDSR